MSRANHRFRNKSPLSTFQELRQDLNTRYHLNFHRLLGRFTLTSSDCFRHFAALLTPLAGTLTEPQFLAVKLPARLAPQPRPTYSRSLASSQQHSIFKPTQNQHPHNFGIRPKLVIIHDRPLFASSYYHRAVKPTAKCLPGSHARPPQRRTSLHQARLLLATCLLLLPCRVLQGSQKLLGLRLVSQSKYPRAGQERCRVG